MTLITSTQNQQVKQIRALSHRKERERTGLFFLEGIRNVIEAIELGAGVEALVAAPELLGGGPATALVSRHRDAGGRALEVTAEVFATLSWRDGPSGLGAVVRQRWDSLPRRVHRSDYWVALYAVEKPGNLGAVLRTCDAAGGRGVMLIGPSVDPYHPTAVQASMGAIFTQQLIRAEAGEFLAWARRQGCAVVGTSLATDRDHRAVTYRPPLVLLMGAEHGGLPAGLLEHCDDLARIPMVGRVDSLNLAVATGVLLYEVMRDA
ncbi:MAG: TrmH family RNA methyltransferase [Dehalococcoidia bacterium]